METPCQVPSSPGWPDDEANCGTAQRPWPWQPEALTGGRGQWKMPVLHTLASCPAVTYVSRPGCLPAAPPVCGVHNLKFKFKFFLQMLKLIDFLSSDMKTP